MYVASCELPTHLVGKCFTCFATKLGIIQTKNYSEAWYPPAMYGWVFIFHKMDYLLVFRIICQWHRIYLGFHDFCFWGYRLLVWLFLRVYLLRGSSSRTIDLAKVLLWQMIGRWNIHQFLEQKKSALVVKDWASYLHRYFSFFDNIFSSFDWISMS